jgi:hypothetical protein
VAGETEAVGHRPYMAADSFGPADSHLFFGRDEEGISLARFIEERPFSVLTAESGTGKTSLLNARVIPLLEKRRWITMAARPSHDPATAIRKSMCDHLMPPASLEAEVLKRLMDIVEGGPAVSLAAALEWHEKLSFEARVAHHLFLPDSHPFDAIPMLSRALRGSVGTDELLEHYEALASHRRFLDLDEQMSLAELHERLSTPEVVKSCEEWQTAVLETSSAVEIFHFLEREWLSLRPLATGLLLIIDQFEEMFTVAGTGTAEAWMQDFAAIVESQQREGGLAFPVRLTLSLRKEFLADLMPHLKIFGTAEQLAFFLRSLSESQAREALCRPLVNLGYRFKDDDGTAPTADRMLDAIRDDDEGAAPEPDDGATEAERRYSPILISMLGAHLWKRLQAEDKSSRIISYARFCELVPSLRNIFEAFLATAMDDLERDSKPRLTRFDALELLDRLVTSGGYRNFVSQEQLVASAPLLSRYAEELLECLDYRHRLIRRERRGRGVVFVEIIHEKLIEPVRSMLNDLRLRQPLRASLVQARDMLNMLEDEPDSEAPDQLPPHLRTVLRRYCARLDLDPLAAKVLLRSLLLEGPGRSAREWGYAIRIVFERMREPTAPGTRRMLLHGAKLEAEIARLERAGRIRIDESRLVIRSVLADTTPCAGDRIGRVMNLWKSPAAA